MYSPETSQKIANWRLQATAGTLSREDLKEAIATLRAGRGEAHAISAASKSKAAAKKAPINSDDLLAGLG